jgi:hypothetical protein
MLVFERVAREIHAGMPFRTPVRNVPFTINSVDTERVVFSVGAKTLIPIPKAIWNDIPEFLRGQGWVRIGARRNVALKATLQYFIDHHPSRGPQHSADANYVVSVLKHLNIVEVKHSRPSEVRLK